MHTLPTRRITTIHTFGSRPYKALLARRTDHRGSIHTPIMAHAHVNLQECEHLRGRMEVRASAPSIRFSAALGQFPDERARTGSAT